MKGLVLWPLAFLLSVAVAQHSEYDAPQNVFEANTDTNKSSSTLHIRAPTKKDRPPARKSVGIPLSAPEVSTGSAHSAKAARRRSRSNRANVAQAELTHDSHYELGNAILTGQSKKHISEHHKTMDAIRKTQKWGVSAKAAQAVSDLATLRNNDPAARRFRVKSNYMRLTSSIYAKKASKHYDTAHTVIVGHQKLRQAGWKPAHESSGSGAEESENASESSHSGELDNSEGKHH